MSKRQNVVVVGSGGAGAPIAHSLSTTLNPSRHNLIVITSRPYFLHLPGSVRAAVTAEGDFAKQVQIPYEQVIANGNGKFVVGEVKSISDEGTKGGFVTLTNGEEIQYSVLILAPGSNWEGPLVVPTTKGAAAQHFSDWNAKFKQAQDIVLVGGGAVGIEFAGEIKDLNPSKNVTIVHGNKRILNDAYPDKFRKDVERRLRKRGINLVLGDIVPDGATSAGNSEKSLTTRNGKVLVADLVVPTRGPRPNTGFIAASLGDSVLSQNGFVPVSTTFQLPAYPRIFAAGDIADLKEQKQVAKYPGHAAVIAANVLSVLSGQKPTKAYKGATEMIIVTIGKEGGASYMGVLWGLTFGNWFSAMVKSKTLLVPMARKSLGLKD
ncbi:hypothetical protein DXG03_003629 [Asterophora parasitica]|uniref:FAD/NAD(P)-binding domain-containing protein n=1 Tax=Asterophora parasitica TaxID=117018 RepID=A0A9P7KBR3_9AGAR|nr:hypothetical protein DXG03_003629 [Asterophora parasitica]